MRLRFLVLILALSVAAGAAAQTEELLISEYVEGSDSNDAIEIFNGTANTVDIASYAIELYLNGSTIAVTIALDSADLEPGDTFVLAHTGFAQPGLANQFSADLNFSGNDALALVSGGTAVDRIGRVGEDPGEYWSCASGTTQSHTLRRLPGVCAGVSDPTSPFDPCDGWEFLPVNTFDGLGYHAADCGTVPVDHLTWSHMKAAYR